MKWMFDAIKEGLAWRKVDKGNGHWIYEENSITGQRRAYRNVQGGYVPLDKSWLEGKENVPFNPPHTHRRNDEIGKRKAVQAVRK